MSYYDLDSILTTSTRLPCTFNLNVPGLGYLEGGGGTSLDAQPTARDIKSGSSISLPLWLGTLLAVSDSTNPNLSPFVTLDFPPSLQTRVINALKADAKSVDLRSQEAHFYSLGCQVLELFEEDELVDVLTDTFKARASAIADHAHNPRGALGEGAEFLRGLDETERQLFRAAHDGPKAVREWLVQMKKTT